MNRTRIFRLFHIRNEAVSEVLGTILLLSIVCALFSVVALSVFNFLPTNSTPSVNIYCEVNGDKVILTHMGGDELSLNTKISFTTNLGSTTTIVVDDYLNATDKLDGKWNVGEKIVYSNFNLLENQIRVMVIDPSSNSALLSANVPLGNKISVTTLDVTNIGLTSAKLWMKYDFRTASGSIRFTYRSSNGGWTNTSWISKSGNGSYNFVINSLSNMTVYYFKAQLNYSSTILEGKQKSFTTLCPLINTWVNPFSPYSISTDPFTITTTGISDLDNVTLYYRWSDDNASWTGGLNEVKDPIDSNTCNLDGIGDKGSENNFPNAQDIYPDTDTMSIQEVAISNDDTKDASDSNTANKDSIADKGTETNYANCQETAPDTNVMTLQETDQDAGTSTMGKTSGSGSSYTTINANTMYGQVFTASSSGEIYQASFYGRSSSGSINAKIVICDSSGNILTNGVSNAVSVSTTAGIKTATFTAGSRPIVTNGQTYWIMVIGATTSIRLYYEATTGATSKADTSNSYTTPPSPTDALSGTTNYRVLYADINNLDYELDREYEFNNNKFSSDNEQVCFYLTASPTETLIVSYWNGASWSSLGNIVSTGWRNLTATGLTSSTYTIQIKDQNQTGEITQHSWTIDCIFLHTWNNTNYNIDFEYQWTAANYNQVSEQVCVYVSSHTGGTENLIMNYWTGSTWSSLGTITTTGWSNFTVADLSTSTYSVQLIGATESGDSVQDSWNIDVIILDTWNTTGGSHGHNWIIWSDANNPDISSPWSWDFTFPSGAGYYEFYTIGKNIGYCGGDIESAPVSADARCRKT